ncbi:hypothetical protein CAEBREN_06802 [Caenorhabditis brenneri]|uniref:Uncharacterized protein n=1 Tax=Caenorhabditis brenneri TaxID=135651 RepID=G0P941_CAEBE|nr:hypothetical protein CAEBREN_06802 [Caenorhabditis brenneri]
MYTGNHVEKIMSLSRNVLLDDVQLRELEKARNELAASLKLVAPEESITQKLHTLLFHMVDMAKDQKTLGVLSEQGIECTHSYFNKLERRFSTFNSKPDRYWYIIRELLCTNMINDLEV